MKSTFSRGDVAAVLLLFLAASLWGAAYWSRAVAAGQRPFFYQSYFEPAVMTACGHGFVMAEPEPPPALEAFLQERRDTFSCAELPPDLKLGTHSLGLRRLWRYLMLSVSTTWRISGISWSGLRPLFGVMFGATIAVSFGIFRLGVGRLLAVAGAVALGMSSLHMANLLHLRDYAKAPFTLTLVFLLGFLVFGSFNRRRLLIVAAVYGIVMGIGFGFRRDLMAQFLPFLVVVALFLPCRLTSNVSSKIGAIAIFLLAFLAAGWPIVLTAQRFGGCQWHELLLGLTTPFDRDLGIESALYDWGHVYLDDFVWTRVSSFANRTGLQAGPVEYCSPMYDAVSGSYVWRLATTFPADILTRAYASTMKVLQLPALAATVPIPADATVALQLRWVTLQLFHGSLVPLSAIVLGVTSLFSIRLALFGLLFVLYFGGYPAVQFHPRHFFHLEFIGWWFVLVAIERAAAVGWAWWRRRLDYPRPSWSRLAAFATLMVVALTAPLAALRWYQDRHVRTMLGSYVSAPKLPLPLDRLDDEGDVIRLVASRPAATTERGPWNPFARFVEVTIDPEICGDQTTVTFRYDRKPAEGNFTRAFHVGGGRLTGPVRLYSPIYTGFRGLEVAPSEHDCAVSVAAFQNRSPFPVLMYAQLPMDWEEGPFHQTLR